MPHHQQHHQQHHHHHQQAESVLMDNTKLYTNKENMMTPNSKQAFQLEIKMQKPMIHNVEEIKKAVRIMCSIYGKSLLYPVKPGHRSLDDSRVRNTLS